MDPRNNSNRPKQHESNNRQRNMCGRRDFIKGAAKAAALGSVAVLTGCGTGLLGSNEELSLRWKEYFKKNTPSSVGITPHLNREGVF